MCYISPSSTIFVSTSKEQKQNDVLGVTQRKELKKDEKKAQTDAEKEWWWHNDLIWEWLHFPVVLNDSKIYKLWSFFGRNGARKVSFFSSCKSQLGKKNKKKSVLSQTIYPSGMMSSVDKVKFTVNPQINFYKMLLSVLIRTSSVL